MCGIVGAIAERDIVPVLIEGLRRLEYRGYDSAGVAVLNGSGHLKRVRTVGKVGCADLTGGVAVNGREYRLEVEVKVGDEEQRPEQVARMRSVRARGGCYVLCRSVEDAVAQIKAFVSSRAPG